MHLAPGFIALLEAVSVISGEHQLVEECAGAYAWRGRLVVFGSASDASSQGDAGA